MTILLLDIPGLHLAYLGCYGNDWVATPNLDKLACEAVIFDQHFAGSQGDLSSGICHLPRPGDLAELPRARNWFVTHGGLASMHMVEPDLTIPSWTERFTQVLEGILPLVKLKPRPKKQLIWAELPSLAPPWHLPPDMLDAYFADEAGSPEGEPWPDPPAMLPSGDEAFDRLQFTYGAVATFVDAQIGWLLGKLNKGKLFDRLLLIVTSSRSLPLGEHGVIGHHRAWQHEESVHLPLLIRLPGGKEGGLRISALTQPVDIIPSLLDCLNLPPAALPGKSLWPLMRQEVAEVRSHAFSGERVGTSVEWALRTREWAYLLPVAVPHDDPFRSPQIYVKPDDRWEVNDVCQQHPELAEEMDRTLRAMSEESR